MHVEADEVRSGGKDQIRIRISDNGTGLVAASAAKPGYGFIGTTERVSVLGGTWHKPTHTGGVTVTSILLPIESRDLISMAEADIFA